MKPFTSKHMCSSPLNMNGEKKDSIQSFTPEMKNVFKLDSAENIGKKLLYGRDPSTYQGGSGSLGIIGGAATAVGKAAVRAAAKKTFAKNNPGVTLGGATKNLPKGTGKSRTGGIHPLITGDRSMKSMKSAEPKKKPFLDKAFDALGDAAVQYKDRLPWK